MTCYPPKSKTNAKECNNGRHIIVKQYKRKDRDQCFLNVRGWTSAPALCSPQCSAEVAKISVHYRTESLILKYNAITQRPDCSRSTGVVYTWISFKLVLLQSDICEHLIQNGSIRLKHKAAWSSVSLTPSSIFAGFPAVLDRHSVNKYGWTTEEGKGRDHKAATEASDSGGEGERERWVTTRRLRATAAKQPENDNTNVG